MGVHGKLSRLIIGAMKLRKHGTDWLLGNLGLKSSCNVLMIKAGLIVHIES